MSAFDLGCVKTQKFEKRRELFSQIKQKRTRSRIPAAIIAIQKNVHSIAVARRYVFTQPRPKADITEPFLYPYLSGYDALPKSGDEHEAARSSLRYLVGNLAEFQLSA